MIEDPLRRIAKNAAVTVLKPNGFKLSGLLATRQESHTVLCIRFERAKYIDDEEFPATATLGVVLERVVLARQQDPKMVTREPGLWHWRERLGACTPAQRDKWWNLRAEEEAAAFIDALSNYGLKVLEDVGSEEAILALFRPRLAAHGRDLPYDELVSAAFLSRLLGDSSIADQAVQALEGYRGRVDELDAELHAIGAIE